MLCKLELNIMKMTAERDYAEEQERLNELAMEKFRQTKENTIAYCENELNEVFKTKAQTGKALIVQEEFVLEKDRIGNSVAYPLKLGDCTYADGRLSYIPNRKKMFNLETMESYLKSHCFSINYEEGTYYSYGLGRQKSTIMIISAE